MKKNLKNQLAKRRSENSTAAPAEGVIRDRYAPGRGPGGVNFGPGSMDRGPITKLGNAPN